MALYGGESEESPMDDMPMGDMGAEPEAYEPKDDEARAFVEAFPDNAWDEDKMSAFKEGIRLCIEKFHEDGYDGGGDEKPSGKGGGGLALLFGEPKKKR